MSTGARYELIAAELRAPIESGEWQVGDRLPKLDDLAAEHDVSVSTIREAQRLLIREGRLRAVHGRGVYVAASTQVEVDPVVALQDAAAAIDEARAALAARHGTPSPDARGGQPLGAITAEERAILTRALTHYTAHLRRTAADSWAGEDLITEAETAAHLAAQVEHRTSNG